MCVCGLCFLFVCVVCDLLCDVVRIVVVGWVLFVFVRTFVYVCFVCGCLCDTVWCVFVLVCL